MTESLTPEKAAELLELETRQGKKNVVMDSQVLTMLMTCARKADLVFNLRLQPVDGKSNSLECGSIVHKFMEVYYGTIIKGLDSKKAQGYGMAAAEMYIRGCRDCTGFTSQHRNNGTNPHICTPDCLLKPICGHRIDDYPGVKNTPPEPDKENPREKFKTGWKWVLTTLEQYAEHYKNDAWVPLEVEIVKSKILYEDDEVRILWKAKLDLTSDTNQGIFPIDHKTMKQKRSETKLNNQFKGQCLVQSSRSVIVNKVGFQTTLEPKEKFERALMSYSAPMLTEWHSETLPFYSKLLLMYAETGYWPPNYSNCKGKYGPCQFMEVCEADPAMREYELKQRFIVGPEWNPTNEDED